MKVKLPYAWNIHFYCPSIKETQHTTLINENLNIPIKVRQLIENNELQLCQNISKYMDAWLDNGNAVSKMLSWKFNSF